MNLHFAWVKDAKDRFNERQELPQRHTDLLHSTAIISIYQSAQQHNFP